MKISWDKMEDSNNPFIRVLRGVLLILIIAGVWMIFNQDASLPNLVDYFL